MKKLIIAAFALLPFTSSFAQDDVYPAKEYKGLLFIKNGIVHVGNGQVLENATIKISNGKIEQIGTNLPIPVDDVKVFDATGKHVYPGLILANSNLGLVEVNSVRASSDAEEIGDYNAGIRSIVAYNTDSKVINTLKQTGVLLANVVPQGGIISGTSSIVQLDAWNWEDAAYVMDNAVHYNMPDLFARPSRFGGFGPQAPQGDPVKQGLEEIEQTKAFLKEARAYALSADRKETNLKFEALKGLFDKSKKFFVHADIVKQMLMAINFKKELGLDVVIVGGSESFQIAELLKQNDIPVIVNQMHSLPTMTEDAVDLPYKLPALLQQAGVLYAINDEDGQHRGKNLPFNAGTAAAYGLTKEQALQAITLNAAKILGIANKTGSIEVGKDANIVISTGDILDMRSNNITHAFIQGRHLDLTDKHKQLYDRYKYKYDIK
jgi:imidazolonepropionase-like amidohydrolase